MRKYLIFLAIFLLLFIIVFRNLYINITTNLVDWADFPFYVWVIDQNITKILSLNFHNFFDTNAFYPHKYTLLFSDITLPQTILSLLPFLLTKNLILSFNIMFLLNFILNFTSSYLFWKQIFKKNLIAFYGSLFSVFSTFFFLELGHLPDLSYWPFFLTLYLVFRQGDKETSQTKTLILIGLGITIQFLASVYLSVFLIFAVILFYLLKLTTLQKIKLVIYQIFIIFSVFLLTSGIFIKGYIDMRNTYNAKRDLKEYINNSANLSDYIFTASIDSIIHKSSIINSWNRLNNSGNSLFPGFLVSTLALFALFKIKIKKTFIVTLELNRQRAYFFILIIIGIIFSLGPRLNFNGNYANIPLPYSFLLKYLPFFEAIRIVIRWSFMFFFGLTYFSLISLNSLTNKSYWRPVFLLIFIIFVLEYIPFNLQSAKNTYITADYQLLKNICADKKGVLIELPLTHLDIIPVIEKRLEYITTIQIASTYHRCSLVNGYSGYDLPENLTLSATLSKYIAEGDVKAFITEMQVRGIDIVKFNQNDFIKELKLSVARFINNLANEQNVQKINEDLFLIKKNKI